MEEQRGRLPGSEAPLEERVRELEAELAAVRQELHAAHEKQRRGDETFKRFSDSGIMGIALFHLSGPFVFANDALLKMIGCPAEEMAAGRVTWDQLTPPEWAHCQASALEELKTSGQCAAYEREYLRRDGTRFWGLFTGVLMADQTAVAFLLDITERKRAEQALAAERERLRVTLASIGDAVIVTDAEGRPTFLNPVAEALTGWTRDQARGMRLEEVFRILNEETRQGVESPVKRVLREGKVVGLANHTVLIARDGTERAIDDSAAPIPDEAGRTVGVVLVFRDVTERRRAEAALRASEREFRSIFELAGSGTVEVDLVTGRFTRVNRRLCEMLGYTEAELLERAPTEITHAGDREREQAGIEALQRGGQDEWQSELRYVRKDGEVVWVMVSGRLIRDEAGRPLRTLSTLHDMTDRKKVEEALREADRRKDEFLAMLAHELRNPLGAISNAAQLLKRFGPEEPRLRRAIETIERQIDHQTHLVDDLLDVSRITRGKISLEREWLDLAWLIRHAGEDHRGAFERAELALRLDLPEEPIWVSGDRTRLNQVLENLLTNAAKFTPSGGEVTVSLKVGPADSTRRHGDTEKDKEESREEKVAGAKGDPASILSFPPQSPSVPPSVSPCLRVDKSVAIVTVRDTGIGIDPAMLPRVFDSFAQADRSLDRRQGGLGLGLAVVKGLIELHGGEVRAESRGLGHGAEFSFTVPLEPLSPAGAAAVPSSAPVRRSLRILVVEDNPDSAETLRDLLELSGHQATIAASGPEAVLLARTARPDVVLCDIGLPGMDGYGVARTLSHDPATANARLVALSGYAREEDRRRSREAGFHDHLAKPVHLADLEALLSAAPAGGEEAGSPLPAPG